ncbi:MAG: transcriptional repressor [Deltaproteobacteria bacterium]|nr:transcriptional repressor [Deltaproteobacteria bacterium]
MKVTHQRTAVFKMLAGTKSHPTPEDVYSAIRQDMPSISLATVYKILDLFYHKGFLRKISTEGQVARYDANTMPHDHLVCNSCGTIRDLESSPSNETKVVIPVMNDFEVSHYDVVFYGTCNSCSGKGNRAKVLPA